MRRFAVNDEGVLGEGAEPQVVDHWGVKEEGSQWKQKVRERTAMK